MAAIDQLPPAVGRELRTNMIAASTSAPEASLIVVKLAASIAVSRRATRQSSDLPANASMANRVSNAIRGVIIEALSGERQARHYRGLEMKRITALLFAAMLLAGCNTFYPSE